MVINYKVYMMEYYLVIKIIPMNYFKSREVMIT